MVKKMNLNEFIDFGYLHELNRRFLHPLGLALEAIQEDDGTILGFGGIWDYREDPEGMCFSEETLDFDKFMNVKKQWEEKSKYREKNLGYTIQPLMLPKLGVNTHQAGLEYQFDFFNSPKTISIWNNIIIGDPTIDSNQSVLSFRVKPGDWFVFDLYKESELSTIVAVHQKFYMYDHEWFPYTVSDIDVSSFMILGTDGLFQNYDKVKRDTSRVTLDVHTSQVENEIVGIKVCY